MNILQEKQESTSSNIANVKTPGYKFQDIVQATMETMDMVNYSGGINNDRRQELGGFVFGNQIDSLYKNYTQGSIVENGNPTDFAIVGNGFFSIQLDDGQTAYTRNGNFRLDDENRLETMDGYPVLGLGPNGQQSQIFMNDGRMNVDFLISDFGDYQELTSIGNTNFTNGGPNQIIGGEVKQGFLEMSNVVIADELVKMIEISREFEANQKLLHTADETLNKAVNDIGRV